MMLWCSVVLCDHVRGGGVSDDRDEVMAMFVMVMIIMIVVIFLMAMMIF